MGCDADEVPIYMTDDPTIFSQGILSPLLPLTTVNPFPTKPMICGGCWCQAIMATHWLKMRGWQTIFHMIECLLISLKSSVIR